MSELGRDYFSDPDPYPEINVPICSSSLPLIYAGIGSRKTPERILNIMFQIAQSLGRNKNTILRSGGAEGADTYFEKGCLSVKGNMEIYLPWRGFNKRYGDQYIDGPTQSAYELAKELYPDYFINVKPVIQKLLVRNIHQVLGKDLKTPSNLVICYCPHKNGEYEGGTKYAIMVAKHYNIPIINLFDWNL